MNYMKQIAQMLGLEWDDEKHESSVFTLNPDGVNIDCVINNTGILRMDDKYQISFRWLNDILRGEAEIIKNPWKPKYGEKYFMPHIVGFEILFDYDIWDDFQKDNYRYENNLIYRTKEEAITEAERILQLRKEAEK